MAANFISNYYNLFLIHLLIRLMNYFLLNCSFSLLKKKIIKIIKLPESSY